MILVSVCSCTEGEWQRSVRTSLKYTVHPVVDPRFYQETFKLLFIRVRPQTTRYSSSASFKRRIYTEQCTFRFRQNISYLTTNHLHQTSCLSSTGVWMWHVILMVDSLRRDLYPSSVQTVCHWILFAKTGKILPSFYPPWLCVCVVCVCMNCMCVCSRQQLTIGHEQRWDIGDWVSH